MDFKVVIECAKCECSLELRPKEFKNRDSLECPNCGQAIPDAVYEDLKSGILTLGKVPEWVEEDSESLSPQRMFTIRIKGFGTLHNIHEKSTF